MLSYPLPFILVVLLVECNALTVQKIANGKIQTFLEPVKLQGISFTKRYLNRSVSTTVKFLITTPVAADSLSFDWLLDGSNLKVARLSSSPETPVDIYSTEVKLQNSTEVTLHLRDKGLVPGNYTFTVSTTEGSVKESALASGFVEAAPILPLFPKDRRILEGDRLLISCEVTGFPKPARVMWRFAPIKPDMMKDPDALAEAKADLAPMDSSNSSSVYQFLTKGVLDDQLLFSQLPSSFNGLYECSVGEKGNGDETLILVNVKDRWAALWPFIGIVIEVAVLVTAILLYERHQMRSRPSKTDTNAVTTVTPGTTGASSPGPKARSIPAQQQQQNNVDTVGEPNNEVNMDGDKAANPEGGDGKQDELRLRGSYRC